MGIKSDTDRTRASMIEAAGELFAKHGFHGVSVRDICSRANASLIALNYHFRDKDGLYGEVLNSAIAADVPSPEQVVMLESLPPREVLMHVIDDYVQRLLAKGGPDWRTLLLEREYLDPSSQFRKLLASEVRPELQRLKELIAEVAGVPNNNSVTLSIVVLYGVVSSLYAYRHVIELLDPGLTDWCQKGNAFSQLVMDLTIQTAKASQKKQRFAKGKSR